MEKSYTLREMLEALRRRRWLALGVTVAVLLVGGIVIASTPDEYRADSGMQIEPHQMPHDFFPTSFVSFDERMRTLKHGVLARPVLERVLRETEYYPDWKSNPDDAREKVARAADLIPRYYAELTRETMATQAKNLAGTLQGQLTELSKRLGAEEQKLVAF